MIGFSIIICTYNGGRFLDATTNHLCKLDTAGIDGLEVIVVDNASTDDTRIIAIEQAEKFRGVSGYSVLQEPMPGKINALIRGVQNAKYGWVVICDDDNWLQSDFLISAAHLIRKFPRVGIFGSQSFPATANNFPLPEWFNDVQGMYAVGKQAPSSGFVSFKQNIWGAGSVLMKDPLRFALVAEKLLLAQDRGEDTEVCYRFILMGYSLYYADELKMWHFMESERVGVDQHQDFISKVAPSRVILRKYHQFIKFKLLNRHLFLSKLKCWGYIMLRTFGLAKLAEDSARQTLVNSLTSFGNDADFDTIRRFHKMAKAYRLKNGRSEALR